MILSICTNPNILEVLKLIKLFILIIKIAVPIILVVVLMIDFMSAIKVGDEDLLKKAQQKAIKRGIAAVLIFLVPTLVNVVIKIAMPNTEVGICLVNATDEGIKQTYYNQGKEYIDRVKQTYSKNDYDIALANINQIKDADTKNELLEELKSVENIILLSNDIDKLIAKYNDDLYERVLKGMESVADENAKNMLEEKLKKVDVKVAGYDNSDYGSGKFEYFTKSSTLPAYAISVPSNLPNKAVPLIVWLHGSGEVGCYRSSFLGSGLLKVVDDWSNYGLANIPAIIVAPQLASGSWESQSEVKNVKNVIDYVKSQYDINENKIVLIGHSLGGSGVIYIAQNMKETFSALVPLSSYKSSPGNHKEYFSTIPMKGYSDSGTKAIMTSFFSSISHSENLKHLTCGHGSVPKVALTEDANKDGISDLVYWMLSQNKQ